MACDPDMALMMTVSEPLALRKIVPDICSLATKHAILANIHAVSHTYCGKILNGSHGIVFCNMKL